MADKKISALNSATTPLAGTEVLPIVQGGNTVKVAVTDLTKGRTTLAAFLGVNNNSPADYVEVSGSGANGIRVSRTGALTQYITLSSGSTGPSIDGSSGIGEVSIGVNASRKLVVNNAGNVTNNFGNYVVGTAGKGIDFSANANAPGMTSELLTWYEEGTWTPVVSFGGGSTGVTYAVQEGHYTRIGRFVTGRFIVVLSSKGSSTGDALVAGLPFIVGSYNGGAFTTVCSNFASNAPTQGYCNLNTNQIVPWVISGTGVTGLTDANFNNNTRLDMWFQYFV